MQKISRIGIWLILILIFLFQLQTQAQSKKYFVITGRIVPEVGEAGTGVIEVKKNQNEITNIEIPKNGRFRFELEFFNEYYLTFKYPGHFNKIIIVSTEIPKEVWERDNDFPPFPMIVQMQQEFEGIDKSFTLKPQGKIFYGKEIDNFEKESYISDIQFQEQIETAKSQANQVQKEAQSISKENAQDLAEKQKNFDQLIKEADTHYQRGEYQMALLQYLEAKKLFPEKAYPNDRVAELQDLVKALEITAKQKADLEQKYQSAITKANGYFDKKTYVSARPLYEEALRYKPGDVYANGRINEIDLLQIKLEQIEKDFTLTMQAANNQERQNEYVQALNSYKRALELKPDSKLAKDKIAETELAIVAVETDKKYLQAIQLADQAMAANDFQKAKMQYVEALKIKSGETYPKNKLNEIALSESQEIEFNGLVANAEKAYANNNFDESFRLFNQALDIKPKNQAVQKRIEDIQKIQKQLAKDQEQKEKNYQSTITQADKLFEKKDYTNAQAEYRKAMDVKPEEIYPKDQIAKIDQILAELQKEEDINRQYAQHIKLAQEAFTLNKLKEARDEYQKAYNFKPFEPVPPARIAEIDKILAQLAETAQLAAMEEAQRLAKEKADKDQYNKAIAAADKSFAEKQYKIARTHYTTTLIALPNEKYPKNQIALIDKLLSQQELDKVFALQKAKQDSLQKARENLFDQAMSAAKEHEQNKQYRQAITKYGEAIQINPTQRSAIQKLINDAEDKLQLMTRLDLEYKKIIRLADDQYAASKLEDALAQYQNALKIKPDEEYPKKQIAEIQAILTTREQNYTSVIQKADQAFDTSDWQMAKISYTEALAIKPKEAYPAQRLKEVNQKIADSNLAELNIASLNKAYAEALEKAEKSFKENQLTTARIQFEVARSLKPDEIVPIARINEIDDLLEQRNKDRLAQAQRELDEKYSQAISVADNSFRAKSYSIAKLQYKQASIIKPDESYPKDQMALCDKLLSEVVQVETYVNKLPEVETAKPVARPVFNPVESAQATEARAKSYEMISNYDEAVKRADDSFGIKDYSVARFFYLKASDIKPKEEYPKNQLELIRKLIDSQLSANDVSGYDNAISKADDAFAKQNYTIAKFFYYKAIEIKSWEKYPKDRINEILLLTNSLLSEKEEKEYRDFLARADEAFYNKDMAIARFYYNKAITIKKDENYPQIKLKDIQKLILQDNQDQQNQEYSKIIEQADQALQAGNFSIARFNYNKALTLRPDDKYPKDQLKSIKAALEKQK
ncbi:MAG TPA: hypothetical protein DCR40_04905 [Prolixibacteraceae bacterium]|nr:hypothetical protein [Prolixibacteraceae bacterium]